VTLSLVDPDNRREVDWAHRRNLLRTVKQKGTVPLSFTASREGTVPSQLARDEEKLRLVVAALDLRRERPEAFAGSYEPLGAGPDVCAFVRGGEVMTVAVLRDPGLEAIIAVPWDRPRRVKELTGGRSYALLAR